MDTTEYSKEFGIMNGYFQKDNLLSLATVSDGIPHVRCIDACFCDGSFYAIVYALSDKMKQIEQCPNVAFCSADRLTGHGTATDLGYI